MMWARWTPSKHPSLSAGGRRAETGAQASVSSQEVVSTDGESTSESEHEDVVTLERSRISSQSDDNSSESTVDESEQQETYHVTDDELPDLASSSSEQEDDALLPSQLSQPTITKHIAGKCDTKIQGHDTKKKKVVVIMEDTERAKPLICHLVLLGADTTVWDAASVMIDSKGPPPDLNTLYFCRTSPSARTRGRSWAASASMRVIEWLESYGASVLNGARALHLEVCKWRQTRALFKHGIASPHTILVGCNPDGMTKAVKGVLGQCGGMPSVKTRDHALEAWQAWWVKPTHGGSGAGAARFEDLATIDRMWEKEEDSAKEVFKKAPDNLLVVQKEACRPNRGQRVNSRNRFVRTFYRAEFVDGRLMYVLKVTAINTAVSACPCDKRLNSDIVYEIVMKGASTRQRCSFVETKKWDKFVSGCLGYMEEANMIVAAFEFLVTHDTHEIQVIDVNSNTNYGAAHEIKAGVECGYKVLARSLYEKAALVASSAKHKE